MRSQSRRTFLCKKKMAAVHFNTIPCQLMTQPIKYKECHIFAIFVAELTTLCLEVLKLFYTFYER